MRRDEVGDLYAKHGPALLAYVASLLASRAKAEDVLHQVFCNLMKSRTPMPGNSRAYLFQAVRNAIRNVRRSMDREVGLDERDAWFLSPSGAIEDSLALQTALRQIPAEQREAIVMHVWGDLTFEEIAHVLGISANTAATRYRYGLSKLRGLLEPAEVTQHAAKQ
jgi:RNA polymerase sigma-70 factor (ECF subfamily)